MCIDILVVISPRVAAEVKSKYIYDYVIIWIVYRHKIWELDRIIDVMFDFQY